MKLLLSVLSAMLLFTISSGAQTIPAYIDTSDLIAYYSFNGNANDNSGNSYNGSVNGAVLTTDRNGSTNSAYYFDGIDDFIEIPTSLELDDQYGGFTISLWYLLDTISNYSGGLIELQDGFRSSSNYSLDEISIKSNYGKVSSRLTRSYRNGNRSGSSSSGSNQTLALNNQWVNIVAVFNTDYRNVTLYSNGYKISPGNSGSNTFTSLSGGSAGSRLIGATVDALYSPQFWKGKIDEVIIWNRALDCSEVASVYAGSSGNTVSDFCFAIIDSSSVQCSNDYKLTVESDRSLQNSKSLRILNGYACSFTDYNIWSTSDDYAVAFWFNGLNSDTIDVLTNSMGLAMGGSVNKLVYRQNHMMVSSSGSNSTWNVLDTGWNHIAIHVKKSGSINRSILYVNGVPTDSVNSSNRLEEFAFGDVELLKSEAYKFLIDDVVLMVGDSVTSQIQNIASNFSWSPSSPDIKRFFNFENAATSSVSFIDQVSKSFSNKISGLNYSGKELLSLNTPICSQNYNITWNDGSHDWERIVPSGNTYSATIFKGQDSNSVSITLPNRNNDLSGYIDVFPDTIISYGNTIDTVVDWWNWPPDTSIVFGAGYEYIMPQNDFDWISAAVSQNVDINDSIVRFKTSGIHRFYLSDWGIGNNSCWKDESVFVKIIDSILVDDRAEICQDSSLIYPVKAENRGILRLEKQVLKCEDISPYQDLSEFAASFYLYWKGGINQTLLKAPGLMEIFAIGNDSLRITDFHDTLVIEYPLYEWNFLTVSSGSSTFDIWIGDSLVESQSTSRTVNLNLKTGFAVGRQITYHPLGGTYGISGPNYHSHFEGGATEMSFWNSALDSGDVYEHIYALNLSTPELICSYDFDPWGVNPQDRSHRQKDLHISNFGSSGGQIYDIPSARKVLLDGQFYSSGTELQPSLSHAKGLSYDLVRVYDSDTIETFNGDIDSLILFEPEVDYGSRSFACYLDTVEISLNGSFDSVVVNQQFYGLNDTSIVALPSSQNQLYTITGYRDSIVCQFDLEVLRHEPNRNATIWNDTIVCGVKQLDYVISGYESVWINSNLIDSIRIEADTTLMIIAEDTTGCKRRDTLTVDLDNFQDLTASILFCDGDSALVGAQQLELGDNIEWYLNGQLIATDSLLYAKDSGEFVMSINRQNGCSYYDTSTVSFYSNPNYSVVIDSVSCYGTNSGAINVQSLDSIWWPDLMVSGYLLDSLPAGTYIFEATTLNGCLSRDTIALYNPDTLAYLSSVENVSCFGSNDGSVLISYQSGVPDFYAYWTDVSDTLDHRTGLAPGVYQAIIGDHSTCPSDTAVFTIVEPDSLTLQIMSTKNINCFNGQDGSITFEYTGGQVYGSYSLKSTSGIVASSGTVYRDSIKLIDSLLSDSYLLVLLDSNGCSDSAMISLTQPLAPLSVSSTVNPSMCPGSSNGSIVNVISGGTPPYQFLWNTGDTTASIFGLPDGNYTLSATDSLNCLSTSQCTIQTLPFVPADTVVDICIVTITDSLKSMVIWNKPTSISGISAFQILKLGVTNWTAVGTVNVNASSYFVDNSSTPTTKAHTYAIQIIDSCSNWWGSTNQNHTTSLLQSSIGTSGQVNLTWTPYQGVNTAYFRVLRKVGNSSFVAIDSVNNQTFNYVDNNPPTGNTLYAIEGVLNSSCTISAKNGTVGSYRTNYVTEQTIGFKESNRVFLQFYPNPARDYLIVEWTDGIKVSKTVIRNAIGVLVGEFTGTPEMFNLQGLNAGLYTIEVIHSEGVFDSQLIIVK